MAVVLMCLVGGLVVVLAGKTREFSSSFVVWYLTTLVPLVQSHGRDKYDPHPFAKQSV